jgi:hypothetical protein
MIKDKKKIKSKQPKLFGELRKKIKAFNPTASTINEHSKKEKI